MIRERELRQIATVTAGKCADSPRRLPEHGPLAHDVDALGLGR